MFHQWNLLAKLKILWNNIRRWVQLCINSNYDQCLELFMIGGGIHQIPGDEPWKHHCLLLYQLLGFYQFVMGVVKVGCSIRNEDNLVKLGASLMILSCLVTICAKVYILVHYAETVGQAKDFINSNCSFSGDPNFDVSVRRQHATIMGKLTLAISFFLCFDAVMLMVPSSARQTIFGIPEQFHVMGATTVRLLQEMLVFMLPIFWGCRYLCSSLTIMPILMGLNNELRIVARGYGTIAERIPGQSSNDGISRKLADSVTMKHFKQMLGVTVEQHVEVLRIIQKVKLVVSHVYGVIYYSVMIIAPLFVLLIIRSGFTLVSLAVFGSTSVSIVECYIWCRMIDSIEETMEKIADCAAALGSGLQYSPGNHSKYIEIRTSLIIVQLNAAQSGWFSCVGIFPMSVESFGNLCMIIYKIVTFLLDFA